MIERAGAFIAVSEYIRERLLEQGYPDSKIVLHRNGIDLDYFSPSSTIEREPIIVFVGRFVEKKAASTCSRLRGSCTSQGSDSNW
jgi:colanic acid/amylovoran biosynthesis glycosyltransferase